jgi:hypothetical protein
LSDVCRTGIAATAGRHARAPPATKSHVGHEGVTLGLRAEHLTEARPNGDKQMGYIDAALEVTEPLGMETRKASQSK